MNPRLYRMLQPSPVVRNKADQVPGAALQCFGTEQTMHRMPQLFSGKQHSPDSLPHNDYNLMHFTIDLRDDHLLHQDH